MRRLLFAASALLVQALGHAQVREIPSPAGPGSAQPNLFATQDGHIYLSWLEPRSDSGVRLRFAVHDGAGWSAARTIAEGGNWFVNWADFPSMTALPDGSLAAHWLVKSGDGTYAYDVHLSRSFDGGATWSPSRMPHRDGTPTEHGFVSLFPAGGGTLGAVWLDGRETGLAEGHESHGGGAMTLRYAALDRDGAPRAEALLDARVCDCCQTAAAITSDGPIVVFRDRSAMEVRDIAIVRLKGGAWSKSRAVHEDGWKIHGCPVNGPAIDADGRRVAVAWFTLAGGQPRVQLAFSTDSGESFGPAITVDDGKPLGRVDTLLLDDDSALVSWLEEAGDGQALRVRRVGADGRPGAAITAAPPGAVRANAFPRMARAGDTVMIAWTGERVRAAMLAPIP